MNLALKNPTRAMGIVLRHLATHPEDKMYGSTLEKFSRLRSVLGR